MSEARRRRGLGKRAKHWPWGKRREIKLPNLSYKAGNFTELKIGEKTLLFSNTSFSAGH